MRLLGIKSSIFLTVRSNWYYDNSGKNCNYSGKNCNYSEKKSRLFREYLSNSGRVGINQPPQDQSRHPQRHTGQAYNHIHRLPVFLSTLSRFDLIWTDEGRTTGRNSPHYQSWYCQRHTVQGTTFLLSLRLQGGVVSKIPFREMCVCDGGCFGVGRLPERHRQGQGGAMPLHSEKVCISFPQLPFTGKAGIGVF